MVYFHQRIIPARQEPHSAHRSEDARGEVGTDETPPNGSLPSKVGTWRRQIGNPADNIIPLPRGRIRHVEEEGRATNALEE